MTTPSTLRSIAQAVVLSLAFLSIASGLTPAARAEREIRCAGPVAPAHPDRMLPAELEILSWNIQKASNAGWAEDLASLGGGVDLAFIQEAPVQAGIPQVVPWMRHPAFARGYTTGSRETGVLTLSAGLPDRLCSFTTAEPWLGTPKAASAVTYPLREGDEELLAINLHAVNFALGLDRYREQFGALRNLLARHRGPVILAGDMNTWSGRRQALVDAFVGEYGLRPVTFEPDLRTTVFGRALDHIYVRGLQARSAEVIPVASSDHNPLRVRLALM